VELAWKSSNRTRVDVTNVRLFMPSYFCAGPKLIVTLAFVGGLLTLVFVVAAADKS
jgi:hypothetical protein